MEDIIWRWTQSQWWGDWKQNERIKALVDEAALFAMTMLADACARKLIRFQVTCDKKKKFSSHCVTTSNQLHSNFNYKNSTPILFKGQA